MANRRRAAIDPIGGVPMVLEGRIVTMDADDSVLARGRIYIKDSTIQSVRSAEAPPPNGFDNVEVTVTGGTMYPGLIELHNHLAYNALQLWHVPTLYTNRDRWSGTAEYRKRISGPMAVLGATPDVLPALIRFVEMKCLAAGVTTSQGVALFSNAGVRRYYRGIVRNVEATDEAALPEAETRIADLDARSAAVFLERLKRESCFLLHLAEGIDPTARKHFLALRISGDKWAIGPQLVGIHSAALNAADFAVYGSRGGAMVWSPLSNLLLYGQTADVASARANSVRIGLGSDWSPSGSKNLLGELKVAWVVAKQTNVFNAREILAMATRDAAAILKWDGLLGSLEAGKRADMVVIDRQTGDPYEAIFRAKETDVSLVIINGVPRFGTKALFQALGASGELIKIGGQPRRAYLKQDTQDPAVGKLSYSDAREALADALKNLPKLAKALEKPAHGRAPRAFAPSRSPDQIEWRLALDEIDATGVSLRARLPTTDGVPTGARALAGRGVLPLSQVVESLVLDPLTVADDATFLDRLSAQANLPEWLAPRLRALYE